MPIKQDNRLLAIKTPLGADVLAVRSINVQEQISRLFQIEADLASEDGEVDFDKVIGKPVTIRLNVAQKEKRYFNGIVSRLVQGANQGGHASYRATIVPWLWLLTRTSDCCIFQDMTVPDIIEDVFKHFGFNDYKLKLSATYPKWEYCVQYRETDFNFVSRLMEQEGIYCYYEHEDGKHTLVLADSISAHQPFPGYADVTFYELEKGAAGREAITDWAVEKEVQPVAYAVQDFDFKKPKTSLLASSNVPRKHGKAEYEIYDYPGEYLEHGEGERLADVRLNELQSQYEVLRGQASARGLAAGHIFKLKNHSRADQNRDYLITGVSLHVDAGPFATAGSSGGSGSEFFSCNFTAIDKSQQFRPARLTPKPIVQGPQTAIVVGPSGEEIYTDEHARVKVHFHWDRHDKSDENSSCWVRVSQFWAGKEWGAIHIPRIGQEVIVEFLEGDPDEPIITGRVYNADQVPPYALPANKTQSGLKSRSSKGGSAPNFNEIRFEDKKGSEEVYIHAEKDQNNVVENDETTKVGHDRTEEVGNDEKITIKHNRTEDVTNDESISIGGSRTESVAKDETISIDGNRNASVSGNESISISKDQSLSIDGNKTLTVGKKESITVGDSRSDSVTKDEEVSIGKNRQTSVGENDTLKVTKNLLLDAGESITIQSGSASITLKKDGTIAIKGKDINLDGSGKINIKASSDVVIKGSKVTQN